jgi:SNF2 family DNA or RNA helicase
VEHIICKDSIDERVMKALEGKDSTQKSLIDAVKAEL